ncbi:unnamed protein product [Orchesella dallaii]|uniref:Transmembrane protein n=1 Tax=Orchesella dallaii TaxID=48710 RepID=A0ABP1RCD9_9HEXA
MRASSVISDASSMNICASFRSPVFIYAFLNLVLTGVELVIVLIATCFIVAPLLAGNYRAFHYFLLEEGNRAIWQGPYPDNYSVDALPLLLSSSSSNLPNGNGSNAINGNLKAEIDEVMSLVQGAQLKIGVHTWSGILLMKCTSFVFGWLLIFAVKRKSYSGCLAWFSYSVPLFIRNVLQLLLDIILGDFFLRELQSQILEGLDNVFQLIGIIIITTYLYKLCRWSFKGMKKSLPFQTEPDVSIREIINERY